MFLETPAPTCMKQFAGTNSWRILYPRRAVWISTSAMDKHHSREKSFWNMERMRWENKSCFVCWFQTDLFIGSYLIFLSKCAFVFQKYFGQFLLEYGMRLLPQEYMQCSHYLLEDRYSRPVKMYSHILNDSVVIPGDVQYPYQAFPHCLLSVMHDKHKSEKALYEIVRINSQNESFNRLCDNIN